MIHHEDLDLATPHCERCLVSLDPRGDGRRPYWQCPVCGLRRL